MLYVCQWRRAVPCCFPADTCVPRPSNRVLVHVYDAAACTHRLRLEVLEAKGLPKTDICSACDPYALVVHEGVAARTVAVLNTSSPRWPPGWPRAFKFPIVHPSSLVQIALMDDDRGSGVKLDDPLGRVVLSLAGRFPRTEYAERPRRPASRAIIAQ